MSVCIISCHMHFRKLSINISIIGNTLQKQNEREVTLEALKKGGKNFKLKFKALDFRNTRSMGMTNRITGLQIGHEAQGMNEKPGSKPKVLPGPKNPAITLFDSDGNNIT